MNAFGRMSMEGEAGRRGDMERRCGLETVEARALSALNSTIDLTMQERRMMYSQREISERGRWVSDVVNDIRGRRWGGK